MASDRSKHDLYMDAELMEVLEEWSKRAHMSRNQFILSSVLEGAPRLGAKLNIISPEESLPGQQPALEK